MSDPSSSPSSASSSAFSPSPFFICPYSCFDESAVGAFKGGFAGCLWGVYTFRQRWQQCSTALTGMSPTPLRSSSPLAALLLSPRLRLLSPLLIYPVKFAALVGLYRLLSCCGCHLSFPSPPSPVVVPAVSASLAGFFVSLPHLDARRSFRSSAGCGLLGGLIGLGQLSLDTWHNRSTAAHGTRHTQPAAVRKQP